jgi:hypothetical protein
VLRDDDGDAISSAQVYGDNTIGIGEMRMNKVERETTSEAVD